MMSNKFINQMTSEQHVLEIISTNVETNIDSIGKQKQGVLKETLEKDLKQYKGNDELTTYFSEKLSDIQSSVRNNCNEFQWDLKEMNETVNNLKAQTERQICLTSELRKSIASYYKNIHEEHTQLRKQISLLQQAFNSNLVEKDKAIAQKRNRQLEEFVKALEQNKKSANQLIQNAIQKSQEQILRTSKFVQGQLKALINAQNASAEKIDGLLKKNDELASVVFKKFQNLNDAVTSARDNFNKKMEEMNEKLQRQAAKAETHERDMKIFKDEIRSEVLKMQSQRNADDQQLVVYCQSLQKTITVLQSGVNNLQIQIKSSQLEEQVNTIAKGAAQESRQT